MTNNDVNHPKADSDDSTPSPRGKRRNLSKDELDELILRATDEALKGGLTASQIPPIPPEYQEMLDSPVPPRPTDREGRKKRPRPRSSGNDEEGHSL